MAPIKGCNEDMMRVINPSVPGPLPSIQPLKGK